MTFRADKLMDGLFYGEVYFVIGKPSETGQNNEVHSPPWGGAGRALIIDKGGKSVTIFCPYAIEAFQVTRNSYEYRGIRPDKGAFDLTTVTAHVVESINEGWKYAGEYGWQRDFDTAAMVLQMLGQPVPMRIIPEGAEPEKPRGGSEADVLGLLKPVKRNGRRGQVLAFFLPAARSIREAMAEFGVTRSNILSQLYLLNKEHGIGYVLMGDAASITLPDGCADPFEPEAEAKAA